MSLESEVQVLLKFMIANKTKLLQNVAVVRFLADL